MCSTSMSDHRKRPRDPSQLAKLIVDIAAGETEDRPPTTGPKPSTPAERGKLGGQKGGKARAKKLSPEQRSAAASKAASARWRR